MSSQTELDEFDIQYVRFLSHVRAAIQKTFSEEAKNGLTQKELAETLGVDGSLISRRLSGPGNITLKTLSELYTAMGRETLANFEAPVPAQKQPAAPATTLSPVILQPNTGAQFKTSTTGSPTTIGTVLMSAA